MIELDHVTVTYDGNDRPTLRDVSVSVDEGELCLVVGRTGSGKSTLLGTLNGLVPHFTGGTLSGSVRVAGRDTRDHPPRELADVVGVVSQDPLAGFVTDTVTDELAYAMEQLGVAPAVMRKRVEEIVDVMGLAELRDRALSELSGGQQQRVAIAAVMTAHPRVLVLDEPTSALDPPAAEEVLAAITRLVHDLGVTVVLAEHRLERVVQYADQVVHLDSAGVVTEGRPAEVFERSTVAPPVVELGRLAGWQPLALSVRDARRAAAPLRERLAPPAVVPLPRSSDVLLRARGIGVRYAGIHAVHDVDLDLATGTVTALMGRNGSGKSSLLWALHGAGPRQHGRVVVRGSDPRSLPPARARELIGLVPQSPGDLLYLDTVGKELAAADGESAATSVPARQLLDRLASGVPNEVHPRDLSEGQRLALVLAVTLHADPAVLLLDEPTRGLDYAAKHALATTLRSTADAGVAVLVATHDVEFVASVADRVIVMADGELVADGPAADVVVASPAFAPQVAKILAPLPFLTVEQVADALEAVAG